MIWWIIGTCLFIFIVTFLLMFINGADQRKRSYFFRESADDEQERIVTEMKKAREARK